MATIVYRDIIDSIIAANGKQYDDEPAVSKIVEYENAFNHQICWGVTWENEVNQYRYDFETEYIRNPRIIWPT